MIYNKKLCKWPFATWTNRSWIKWTCQKICHLGCRNANHPTSTHSSTSIAVSTKCIQLKCFSPSSWRRWYKEVHAFTWKPHSGSKFSSWKRRSSLKHFSEVLVFDVGCNFHIRMFLNNLLTMWKWSWESPMRGLHYLRRCILKSAKYTQSNYF